MRTLSFKHLFLILFAAIALLLAASVLEAWSGPTASPPQGNVAAPVNVGGVNQVKDGGLSLGALSVFGNALLRAGGTTYLNFGAGVLDSGHGLRDSAGTMQYKDTGGQWTSFKDLGGGGGGGGGVKSVTLGPVKAYTVVLPPNSNLQPSTPTCPNGSLLVGYHQEQDYSGGGLPTAYYYLSCRQLIVR